MQNTDTEMTSEEIVSSYVQYKFSRAILMQEIQQLSLALKLGMADGPIYTICQLRVIQLNKMMFALELEQGLEVRIPKALSQNHLPISFRYYDCILNVVKRQISLNI